MLVMGEVRTGLLQNSGEIAESLCRDILGLLSGERVRVSRRPIVYAVSPDLLTGVDCRLSSASKARIRGVGTVVSRTTITGGRVLQGSSHIKVTRSESDHRLSWSHYLARPGVVEVFGKVRVDDLSAGFTDMSGPGDCLDLGAVSERFMDVIQSSRSLDRKAPFKSARTRLRWVAETGDAAQDTEVGTVSPHSAEIHFVLGRDQVRTVRIVHPGEMTPAVAEFCEDLALHDWLLTTLLTIVERARIGAAHRLDVTARLAPAVDHLLHLWMPGARSDDALTPLWESLERRPGFTRQWDSLVDRVRDQFAVNTSDLLRDTLTLLRESSGQ